MKIDPYLYGMSRGLNNSLSSSLRNMSESCDSWYETAQNQLKNVNMAKCHVAAHRAEIHYLMKIIDDNMGKENNPARMNPQIEGTNEYATIPAGPRKGERITMREWHFFEGAKNRFLKMKGEKNVLSKWTEMIIKVWCDKKDEF
jgi:hypothetical protein